MKKKVFVDFETDGHLQRVCVGPPIENSILEDPAVLQAEADKRLNELLERAADAMEQTIKNKQWVKFARDKFIQCANRPYYRDCLITALTAIKPKLSKIKPLKVPFDKEGNLIHQQTPQYSWRHIPVSEWKDNYEFSDTLRYSGSYKGKAAKHVIWRSETTGREYPMFARDFEDMLANVVLDHGSLCARWTFVKRFGNKYGLAFVRTGGAAGQKAAEACIQAGLS